MQTGTESQIHMLRKGSSQVPLESIAARAIESPRAKSSLHVQQQQTTFLHLDKGIRCSVNSGTLQTPNTRHILSSELPISNLSLVLQAHHRARGGRGEGRVGREHRIRRVSPLPTSLRRNEHVESTPARSMYRRREMREEQYFVR